MNKKIINLISAIIGLLVVGGILMVCLWQKNSSKVQVPVLLMGDSTFGNCRDATSVAYVMSENLKDAVFNGAFGGTTMALLGEDSEDNYMDAFNFADLSMALAGGDFGSQQTIRCKTEATANFPVIIDDYERLDFSKIQVLVICYGLNDYMAGVALDNAENPYDLHTYAGALRSGVKNLQKSYPNLRIILVSPTYCWFIDTIGTCETENFGGGYLEEYVLTEKKVAEELNVEFIDWYHDVYEDKNISYWDRYTEDGVHPNEKTRKWMADYLTSYINS